MNYIVSLCLFLTTTLLQATVGATTSWTKEEYNVLQDFCDNPQKWGRPTCPPRLSEKPCSHYHVQNLRRQFGSTWLCSTGPGTCLFFVGGNALTHLVNMDTYLYQDDAWWQACWSERKIWFKDAAVGNNILGRATEALSHASNLAEAYNVMEKGEKVAAFWGYWVYVRYTLIAHDTYQSLFNSKTCCSKD